MPDGNITPTAATPILETARPELEGAARLHRARKVRTDATDIPRPETCTDVSGDERAYADTWAAQFTKGLQHDAFGMVETPEDYAGFVDAMNVASSKTVTGFDVRTADPARYTTTDQSGNGFPFRAWESPRAGHAHDLSGPDSESVGMYPAPKLGGSELTAEMAEVYGLALLRDMRLTDIASESTASGPNGVSPRDVIGALNALPYFAGTATDLDAHARQRQTARFKDGETEVTGNSIFRGSTPGSKTGPYLSQFMLIGGEGQTDTGLIQYGSQTINQRTATFQPGLDFMGDWHSWLDVQNGADTRGLLKADHGERFITTPRDLASYVRVDALYQAYLNAALILLSHGAAFDQGFPAGPSTEGRDAFATYGAPDLLAVLTSVSSLALKAVRRQKFNYHRRSRPERVGGLLNLMHNGEGVRLGTAESAVSTMHSALGQTGILEWISDANATALNVASPVDNRGNPHGWETSCLLPMAFVEGSPMHPAYGAGHATVAGACVTVLKAFFETFQRSDAWDELPLSQIGRTGIDEVYVPDADGECLQPVTVEEPLTLVGELDKLAANISIGRNMAGVHYYTDYYDSLRMGERIAVGMLQERLLTYQDPLSLRLKTFDGDHMIIGSQWASTGRLMTDITLNGDHASFAGWWTRHV